MSYTNKINFDAQRTFKNADVAQFLKESVLAANKEKKHPGVTRILSATESEEKKKGLERWRKRVGEAAAAKILATANAQGSAVDSLLESYLHNKDLEETFNAIVEKYGSNDNCNLDIVIRHFNGIRNVLDDDMRFGNVYGTQVTLRSDTLKLFGYADCIAFFDDKLSVIDFKTSKKSKRKSWCENYFLQETAYALMFSEMTNLKVEQIVTIMGVEEFQPVSGYSYVDVFIEPVSRWQGPLMERINEYYEQESQAETSSAMG